MFPRWLICHKRGHCIETGPWLLWGSGFDLEQRTVSDGSDETWQSVLLFSLRNRGEHSGRAQPVSAVSGSVLLQSPRLCVCDDVMLLRGCVWGCGWGVGFGRCRGMTTMMAEPLTFWSWPSSTESPAGWSLFTAAGEGGRSPHVATSPLLALAWANDPRSGPWGQKVRGRPWANTSFSECSHTPTSNQHYFCTKRGERHW